MVKDIFELAVSPVGKSADRIAAAEIAEAIQADGRFLQLHMDE